jgi:hypothetical protein
MPARPAARLVAALLGYVCVALLFSWPLPLHLASVVPGSVGGDTGVYIWNLWLFRHEIIEHHNLPFLTLEILALTPSVPLVLHNYTTFANIIAFPLLPLIGTVATFNAILIGSGAFTAYAMYLFARARIHDEGAAWIAGLMFGFSTFMSARVTEHFSLVLAAPLPIFALVLHRIAERPTLPRAFAAGGVVAWAFLCDQYYAVYCLLMALWLALHSVLTVQRKTSESRRLRWRALLDLALLCLAGLIIGIIIRGGGRVEVFGIRVSIRELYNPMFAFTVLAVVRLWIAIRPRVAVTLPPLMPQVHVAGVAALGCLLVLGPLLYSAGTPFRDRTWLGPRVFWRSSPPGLDLLAFFVPNPMHPWFGPLSHDWLQSMPNGFAENVAAVPWIAIAIILIAVIRMRLPPPVGWLVFTGSFMLLSLGPFIRVGGHLTYVPAPWALLRYMPVIGAARMPTRMAVLMMFGVAMLTAIAVGHLRARSRRPVAMCLLIGAALLFELLPAPRALYSAEVPSVYHVIAKDPRPLRVMNLPFGLRDGLSSRGNFSAASQYHQTVHQKPLVGGYLSRLPRGEVDRYRRNQVMRVLLRLSEGTPVSDEMLAAAVEKSDRVLDRLQLGYVVVDTSIASPALIDFAKRIFRLTFVTADGPFELFRTPLAEPAPSGPR